MEGTETTCRPGGFPCRAAPPSALGARWPNLCAALMHTRVRITYGAHLRFNFAGSNSTSATRSRVRASTLHVDHGVLILWPPPTRSHGKVMFVCHALRKGSRYCRLGHL